MEQLFLELLVILRLWFGLNSERASLDWKLFTETHKIKHRQLQSKMSYQAMSVSYNTFKLDLPKFKCSGFGL